MACQGTDPSSFFTCDIGLPDLDTSKKEVQGNIVAYLNELVDLGVAGIRVDAAKHIAPDQLSEILDQVKPPGLFVNQEVILESAEECSCLQNDMFYGNGKVWEFKTPMLYYDVFSKDGNMEKIRDMDWSNPGGWSCGWVKDELPVSFVVNHDRLLNPEQCPYTITIFNDVRYRLALITLLAHPYGQPNVLSSINFDYDNYHDLAPVIDPDNEKSLLKSPHDAGGCGYWKDSPMPPYACEHRWPEVRNMVTWRAVAGTSPMLLFDIYNQSVLMMTRGQQPGSGKAFVVVNNGPAGFEQVIDTMGMPAGVYCNVVTQQTASSDTGGGSVEDCYPCTDVCPDKVTVGGDGKLQVQLPGYSALAIHIGARVPQGQTGTSSWSGLALPHAMVPLLLIVAVAMTFS